MLGHNIRANRGKYYNSNETTSPPSQMVKSLQIRGQNVFPYFLSSLDFDSASSGFQNLPEVLLEWQK